ncbi:ABC transporter substrate-binding protein [Mesorhizobium sp. CO1-1-8]|uniref:ABC transporter substrate-binding protein n=1 Tax=Mesorhizobium sp. CO1-1-8 TaxID=2876631 RepID=UPI001CD08A9B|nr:ABC transporter substrate-binding protein [Mesorhizobium sp. CO1-1-8]MBZ9772515.1 ABC transporter substrate-binding protein [Mesorhizobium sp. CO1-1-8]
MALALTTGIAAARDLTVVSWGGTYQDAQRKIYFEPYSKVLGKPVLDETWDGGIGVLQAKVKAGAPNWDAVQVEAEELALGCADGLFEKVDWDKLGGKDKFLASAVSPCGVGAIVWSTAIAYDSAKLADGPKSWADFWDVKKFPGKRALRKGPKYTLEFALLADGVSADKVYDVLSTPDGVDRAFKKLDELKPNLVWWESGAQPLQLLASGEVTMASAYNGRITGINKTENRAFKVVWPGSIYAVDSWVILKGAENKTAAEDFIAFASKPENQVKLPDYVAYGLPNNEAASKVAPALQAELPTALDNLQGAIALNTDFWIDHSEELTKRFNAWLAQ